MTTIQNSNHSHEIDVLRQIYNALNQNDIPAVLKFFDPQIERIEFEGYPFAGVYRGLAEVEAHFIKGRGTWAEGSCEPERFIGAGDKVIVFVHVRVRQKDKSDWNEGHVADVYTFRNDKVIEFRSFMESQQAIEWAGINNA